MCCCCKHVLMALYKGQSLYIKGWIGWVNTTNDIRGVWNLKKHSIFQNDFGEPLVSDIMRLFWSCTILHNYALIYMILRHLFFRYQGALVSSYVIETSFKLRIKLFTVDICRCYQTTGVGDILTYYSYCMYISEIPRHYQCSEFFFNI